MVHALFLDLKGFTTETKQRPRQWKTWISERRWNLIDRRAALRRRHDRNSRALGHILTRRITHSIKRDRRKREEEFGVAIEAILDRGNVQGAW
jgi:hypothetical protein